MELNIWFNSPIHITTKEGDTIYINKDNCSAIEMPKSKDHVVFHMNNGKFYACTINGDDLLLDRIF